MKKEITQELLEEYYLIKKLNPYEIAKIFTCDHKTVRAYLKKYSIPMRSASEYNYLPRKRHESPNKDKLYSKISLMGHAIYICEGWHTEKTDMLNFCNQDPVLINIFIRCLREVYSYNSSITLEIDYNWNCEKSRIKAQTYADVFSHEKTKFTKTNSRKNPIIRIVCGGKNLAREFIANAYELLTS